MWQGHALSMSLPCQLVYSTGRWISKTVDKRAPVSTSQITASANLENLENVCAQSHSETPRPTYLGVIHVCRAGFLLCWPYRQRLCDPSLQYYILVCYYIRSVSTSTISFGASSLSMYIAMASKARVAKHMGVGPRQSCAFRCGLYFGLLVMDPRGRLLALIQISAF